MAYTGHMKNGVIVLDEPVEIPEGTKVRIDFEPVAAQEPPKRSRSFEEHYATVIGKAKDLREDGAENHDHYLYGAPKK